MSKSRLEKFLYALYSLDSSDLPNPLSRIEELYKCLVTGEEAPTFKPLSRVEKYLMAILGVYDVDSLPNPLNRVEALLYKLATGDDSLEDFDIFLSEHEELLAEIIRNGGVGGNIDIGYVLYTLSTEFNTLYNTAEKPVKSAILKGCTLVNLLSDEVGEPTAFKDYNILSVKENTKYIIFIDLTSPNSPTNTIGFLNEDDSAWRGVVANVTSGISKHIIETQSGVSNKIRFHTNTSGTLGTINRLMIIEYREGMENWDIPYFDGMQSVKMPVLKTVGKNLLEGLENGSIDSLTGKTIAVSGESRSKNYMTINGQPFTISRNVVLDSGALAIRYYDINKNYIGADTRTMSAVLLNMTFTPPTEAIYMKFKVINSNLDILYQVEQGSTPTAYEPYKSNILTVNEEVELRGIGDVQDTLDCLTGEVTERIGEVVLNGSDDVIFNVPFDGVYEYELDGLASNMIITIPKTTLVNYGNPDYNGYYYTIENNIRIINHDCKSVSEFKQWLSQNPILIQYQLKTESVKTVDLSVVDRDGSNTKLSTFDDITHVTLSSEGLIPEAELEVATKNEEVLNTMSLEMDDISTTQNALQETSDIQSENVDATMVATTEIYEGLL